MSCKVGGGGGVIPVLHDVGGVCFLSCASHVVVVGEEPHLPRLVLLKPLHDAMLLLLQA